MTAPDPTMTPQQAFAILCQELAASASNPIIDVDGTKLTMRQAIERVFWKETFLLPLSNRPADPTKTDDQYGHVLSARVEGLITQAILADLAARLGTDVAGIRTQVLDSLKGSTS